MHAKLNKPRVLFWFDAAGAVLNPALLTGELLSGATVLATLTWVQDISVPNAFASQEVTATRSGSYRVVVSYDGAAIDAFDYDVGNQPTTAFPLGLTSAPRLSATLAGGTGLTISYRVITAAGAVSALVAAPYDAASASYVATTGYLFDVEAPYLVVWHKVVVATVTPFLAEDAYVCKLDGKEFVAFSLRDQTTPEGVPLAGVTLVISETDGTQVAQGLSGDDGMLALAMPPAAEYIATLYKAGTAFSINNFEIDVPDSDVTAGEHFWPLTTPTFTYTTSAVPEQPALCRLTCLLRGMHGQPLAHADVQVSLVSRAQLLGSAGIADVKRVCQSDANGLVEFDLVQGVMIEVAISPIGLRRIFTVPAVAGPLDLLALMAAAPDLFDIVVPSIPAAPRYTL